MPILTYREGALKLQQAFNKSLNQRAKGVNKPGELTMQEMLLNGGIQDPLEQLDIARMFGLFSRNAIWQSKMQAHSIVLPRQQGGPLQRKISFKYNDCPKDLIDAVPHDLLERIIPEPKTKAPAAVVAGAGAAAATSATSTALLPTAAAEESSPLLILAAAEAAALQKEALKIEKETRKRQVHALHLAARHSERTQKNTQRILTWVPNPDGKLAVADPFDFTRLGVRIPTVVVSPWVPKGSV
jgi:hypothetical protein